MPIVIPIFCSFPPALAMAAIIREKSLKPYMLVHPNCLADLPPVEDGEHDAVVIGDAVDDFSFKNINKAFQVIIEKNCPYYSLGKGKFYREDGKLQLDVGAYAALLEFATDKPAIVVGKPSPDFFQAALNDMKVAATDACMVGDDIVSDVGGAQNCGLQGILVRTGKYRASDENHPKVKPDKIVDNLLEIVELILK